MQKATIEGLRRGGWITLAMTTILLTGCGGGDNSSAGSNSGSGSGSTPPATANAAPTISGTPATQATVGQAYNVTPQATDADGDMLAFSIQNKPQWADFNTATGNLSGTPGAQAAGAVSNVVISVSDGKASAALPAFSITVAAAATQAPSATPAAAAPSTAVLSWDVPTQTTSGATLSNLTGYRIHYGTNQNAMVQAIEVSSPGTNRYTVQNLPRGTYYFAVRAITANGESKLSNVITKTVT